MIISKEKNGNALTLKVKGRIDTATSPKLQKEIEDSIEGVETLAFDFSEMEYISSSGLSVLLSAQKKMNGQGKMTVKNVSETVMEIFEITGFSDILTIE